MTEIRISKHETNLNDRKVFSEQFKTQNYNSKLIKNMRNQILKEYITKNLLVILALVFVYFPIRSFFYSLQSSDLSLIATISTLLIMAFLFADYAFTYTTSDLRVIYERVLDHSITAIIMFGTGTLLEVSVVALNSALEKPFALMGLIAVLFYISLVLYDFWDLNRALKNYR